MSKNFWRFGAALVLLTSCVAENPAPTASSSTTADCAAPNQIGQRLIVPNDLTVGDGYSTSVISAAQKFILPVPAFADGGEPLVYPPSHEDAGQPILDYQGDPIGDRGLVFFNGKDQSWQAAAGDGEAVIIINEVTAEQANQLYREVQSYTADPNGLTLEQLKQVIALAQDDLGLVDMYNSDRTFIRENMTPAAADAVPMLNDMEIEAYGFKKRDARDINQAIYIPGEFVFEGPAATPQEFDDGGVIVEQGGEMRGVQPDIFERTYKLEDGSSITSAITDLETQCD